MFIRLLSKSEKYPIETHYIVSYEIEIGTPKDSIAKTYENKNEMIVTLVVPKKEYKDEDIQKLLKWAEMKKYNEDYYRYLAINLKVGEDNERSIVFTHAEITADISADTKSDFVTIELFVKQKEDKYIGVVFGLNLEDTYREAEDRLKNPPTLNIYLPPIKKTVAKNVELLNKEAMPLSSKLNDIKVEEVSFNYGDKKNGTVDISKNYLYDKIEAPEWKKDIEKFEDSCVCYNIKNIPDTISIKVKLKCSDKYNNKPVKIKGVATAADGGSHTIFGESKEISTNFKGDTVTIELKFSSGEIKSKGIYKRDITLTWNMKCSDKTFKQSTNHQIYIILDNPREPWKTVFWIRALKYACEWAQGKKSEDEIASAITTKVNTGLNLIYVDGQRYGYFENFNIKEFIKDIDMKLNPMAVNCYTCSNIVCSFSNLLGCNLSTFEFPKQNVKLKCKNIKLLGTPLNSEYVPYKKDTKDNADWSYSYTDKYFFSNDKDEVDLEVNNKDEDDTKKKKLLLGKAKQGIVFGTHSIAFKENSNLSLQLGKNMPDNVIIYDSCLCYVIDGKELVPSGMNFGDYCKKVFQPDGVNKSISWKGRSVL